MKIMETAIDGANLPNKWLDNDWFMPSVFLLVNRIVFPFPLSSGTRRNVFRSTRKQVHRQVGTTLVHSTRRGNWIVIKVKNLKKQLPVNKYWFHFTERRGIDSKINSVRRPWRASPPNRKYLYYSKANYGPGGVVCTHHLNSLLTGHANSSRNVNEKCIIYAPINCFIKTGRLVVLFLVEQTRSAAMFDWYLIDISRLKLNSA